MSGARYRPHRFVDLWDTPGSLAGQRGQIPKVNQAETGFEFTAPSAVPTRFSDLADVPSYTGNAGFYPRVNVGETGIEFVSVSGGSGGVSGTLLVSDYCVCDGKWNNSITGTAGSNVITVSPNGQLGTSDTFSAGDVGKPINIMGWDTGLGGTLFSSTIAGFISSTQVQLADTLPQSLIGGVYGGTAAWGTDDQASLQSCFNDAVEGQTILFPSEPSKKVFINNKGVSTTKDWLKIGAIGSGCLLSGWIILKHKFYDIFDLVFAGPATYGVKHEDAITVQSGSAAWSRIRDCLIMHKVMGQYAQFSVHGICKFINNWFMVNYQDSFIHVVDTANDNGAWHYVDCNFLHCTGNPAMEIQKLGGLMFNGGKFMGRPNSADILINATHTSGQTINGVYMNDLIFEGAVSGGALYNLIVTASHSTSSMYPHGVTVTGGKMYRARVDKCQDFSMTGVTFTDWASVTDFNVTANAQNVHVANCPGAYKYRSGAGKFSYTGRDLLNNRFIVDHGGPIDSSGAGVPTANDPDGSTYRRTDGASGSTYYVRESGSWVAK